MENFVTKPLAGTEGTVELSVRLLCDAWRLLCRDAPGRREASAEGVEYIFSGLPVAFFNIAILTQPLISAAALRSFGESTRTWADEIPVPWFLAVTHETLESGVDATAILGECDLVPAVPLTGMFATHVAPAAGLPADLGVSTSATGAECESMVDINSAAYAMDLGPAKVVLGSQTLWKDHVAVLGTVGGTPVSSAAVLMAGGCRYVALVATEPAHQRHGYAEAVMRQALTTAAARHGELPTVLHATDAGRPVYARMGYTTIATHTLFMDAALLVGH